ncbi:NUDIX domain-containing protein [Porticoccaceae bacterium]|nr:NUDIX domain-containing protein [Porticoccaceae bacterium]
MAYEDKYRLSSHAVIVNNKNEVLLLRANYGNNSWGLPGGALDIGETIQEALVRECQEEMSLDIEVEYLSGVYYHSAHESQAFIFKCKLKEKGRIVLSNEHTEYAYIPISDLSSIQAQRVKDCLNFDGVVKIAKF